MSTNITAEVQEGFATRLQPIECEVTSSLSHASHIQNITGELLRGGGEGCERDAALRLTAEYEDTSAR